MCAYMSVCVPSESRVMLSVGQGQAVVEGVWLGTQRPGLLPLTQMHSMIWAICLSLALSPPI